MNFLHYKHVYICALVILLFACSKSEQDGSQSEAVQTGEITLPQGEITYTAPEGWVKHPPSSQMRKDQYVLPGQNGLEDGELVVYHFPEMGGMVEANLNRWYGQLVQPDGSDTAAKAESSKQVVNGIPVTTVFVTGTYLKPESPMDLAGPKEEKPGYAMLAAIAETAAGPWFFKATGPEATLAYWRPDFDAFVASLKIE
jgi:hypothetical protein